MPEARFPRMTDTGSRGAGNRPSRQLLNRVYPYSVGKFFKK